MVCYGISGVVNCLISYRAGAWHYFIFPDFLKSPVSKWRIVGVKTRTKAFFFEEIQGRSILYANTLVRT